jgi:hypothetical protein
MHDPPPPDPAPLTRLISDLYLTLGDDFWCMAPRACSLEVMRRVFARAYRPRQGWEAYARDPAVHLEQYQMLDTLAQIPPEEADDIVKGWHVHWRRHPYPMALFDPLHRMGRWP